MEEMQRDVCLLHPWRKREPLLHCGGIVLPGQNSKLCSKSEAKNTQHEHKGSVFAQFQRVCKFQNDISAP